MIITCAIESSLDIRSLSDLRKLKYFKEEGILKINKSKIARELNVDRRTVDKYIDGYQKPSSRKKSSSIDPYYDLIHSLLGDECEQVFFYKKILWRYLKDNHGLECAESTFRRWIQMHPEFDSYFNGTKNRTVNSQKKGVDYSKAKAIHYETKIGEEAQLDWKEDMNFKLKDGNIININIFSLVYSYSRFKVFYLSMSRKRSVLMHLLDQAFEAAGGVPRVLKTDNMKTVMDEPRTPYSKGKVNLSFENFANDYSFKVKPCVAGHPWSKGKVENPMKELDELFAYNGKLDFKELNQKINEINQRLNSRVHTTTGKIPILHIQKEKDFLQELPRTSIRNLYQIPTQTVKVDSQSMVSYRGNKYSVDPGYIGETLHLQAYEGYLHIYDNTDLIAVHSIGNNKYNDQQEHYETLLSSVFKGNNDEIKELSKENIKQIGEIYK